MGQKVEKVKELLELGSDQQGLFTAKQSGQVSVVVVGTKTSGWSKGMDKS